MILPAFMPLPPPSGEISAGWHRLPIRVIYADTDAGGVVYHANYLNFAERSRNEMFRAVGVSGVSLKEGDEVFFVVRSAEIDYRAPARLDDALEVRSRIHRFGQASLEIEQQVWRWLSMESRHLVTILVRLVCVDRFFVPKRIPEAIRTACTPYSTAHSQGK